MNQKLRILALLTGAAALGCSGTINSDTGTPPGQGGPGPSGAPGSTPGGPSGGNNPSSPPPSNVGALNDTATVPGPAPLRRLTTFEYNNTVRDLLGVTTTDGAKLTDDQGSSDSGFVKGGSITGSTDARSVMTSAEDIASAAVAKLATILPCKAVPSDRPGQDTCADQFVDKFGLRAFRRPLSMTESADLKALYRAHRAAPLSEPFDQAIGAVISAVLQTPYFLYHWEQAAEGATKDGQLVRLGGFELASRLSYLFWATMPDDALFTSAQTGKLNSPDDVAREAQRLLADDRARAGLGDFFDQYLELGNMFDLPKDQGSLPLYSTDLVQSMINESHNFVASLFFGPKADGKMDTLLTSSTSVIDGGLAKLYGVPSVTGTDSKSADLDGTKRAGIFTQAAFLTAKADATDSHPVKRGDAILRRVLCTELIIPATLVVPPLPEPVPGQTTRERFSVHHESPCASCHQMIDPIGFSFEHYDAIGGYRTTDAGKPIDATGQFSVGSKMLKFDGAVELMKGLAQTTEAKDCMATQWLRYTLRRREVGTEDPTLKVLKDAVSSGDLRQLMIASTKARTFTHRALSPGEVAQ
jgi:hypothetical protein